MKFPILFVLVLSAASPARAGSLDLEPCFPIVVEAARRVAAAGAELRAIHVEEDETDVPPAARSGLRTLKTRLGEYLSASLGCSVAEQESPERMATALADGLVARGARSSREPAPPGAGPYGEVTDLAVERLDGSPALLVITASFAIPCGSDAVLWLFERRAGGWTRLMTVSNDDYGSVGAARGSFRAAVTRDGDGKPLVLTGDVSPWCSSNWQELRIEVHRPGQDPTRSRRLFRAQEPTFLADRDEPFTLALVEGSFRVVFEGSQSLDLGRLVRTHTLVGRVDGDLVTVVPASEEPTGFVDDWVDSRWEETLALAEDPWADPPAWREWHERLQMERRPETEFRETEPCPGEADCWSVALDLTANDADVPSARLVFTVIRKAGEEGLRLRSIEEVVPPSVSACGGEPQSAGKPLDRR